MHDRVLVFVPMYNCAPQIPRVLAKLRADGLIHGVLVVDNRSTDDGREVARGALRSLKAASPDLDVHLVRNHENYGLGGSHKVAFRYAMDHGYTWIVVLHGDDQGDLSDLLPRLAAGEHRELDALLGARFHPDARLVGYSAFRTFGNRVFNRFFSLISGQRLYDLGSGLNLYRVDLLRDGFWAKFPDDLTFNYCMILAHVRLRHHIRFFPITWREDDQISNVKLFTQARRVLDLLRAYGVDPDGFLRAEHRAKPRDAYTAEELPLT